MGGYEDIDCQIVIHGLSYHLFEIGKLTDTITLRLQNGTIDRKTAIMRIESCSEDEAEEIMKRVDEDREKEAKYQQAINPNPGNSNSNQASKPKVGNQ